MFSCEAHTESVEGCRDCLRLSRPLAATPASGYTDDYVEGLLSKVEFHSNKAVDLQDKLDDVKDELKTLVESDDQLKHLAEELDSTRRTLQQHYCVISGEGCGDQPCSVHELETTRDRLADATEFINLNESIVLARIQTERESTSRANKAEEKYESMKVFYEAVVKDLHREIRSTRITRDVVTVIAFGFMMWLWLS